MELAIRYQHTFVLGFEKIEERRFMHYSNLEGILLVGEVDFSFCSVLEKAFGFAFNMVSTSLDRRGLNSMASCYNMQTFQKVGGNIQCESVEAEKEKCEVGSDNEFENSDYIYMTYNPRH